MRRCWSIDVCLCVGLCCSAYIRKSDYIYQSHPIPTHMFFAENRGSQSKKIHSHSGKYMICLFTLAHCVSYIYIFFYIYIYNIYIYNYIDPSIGKSAPWEPWEIPSQGAALGALWSQLWAFLGWYNAVQLATWQPVGCGWLLIWGQKNGGRAPKLPKKLKRKHSWIMLNSRWYIVYGSMVSAIKKHHPNLDFHQPKWCL